MFVYHETENETAYTLLRANLIGVMEGYEQLPYVVQNVPHIGIGFNIESENREISTVLDVVLVDMGFALDRTDALMTDAQFAREQMYINQILDALEPGLYTTDAALRSALDGIMASRAQDAVLDGVTDPLYNRRADFRYDSDDDMLATFNNLIQEYETRVNDWWGDADNPIPQSRERAALLSLAYQGYVNTGHSQKLKAAMTNDDRAEAWYEIRYNTSVEPRRFLEADLFGLYNETQTEADYKAAYRMLTRHPDILGADGFIGGDDDYDDVNQARLNTAINWGDQLDINVQNLAGNLQPALDYLGDTYFATVSEAELNGSILVGEDNSTIYYRDTDVDYLSGGTKNDLIFGESGNDTLSGGGASDVLYGGDDDDTLYGGNYADTEDGAADYLLGGEGFDIYHVGNGDVISDADSEGRVFYDGTVLLPGLHGSEQDENQYVSLDGRFTYTFNGTDLIVTVNGSEPAVSFTIRDFSSGDLGIALREMPDTSYSSPYQITQAHVEGEWIVENDNDPNTADFSSTANDAIIGLPGDGNLLIGPATQGIVVYGDGPDVPEEQQGTDGIHVDLSRWSANVGREEPDIPLPVEGAVVFAQGGDDWVGGSYDHDWIEGGTGNDAIESIHGDDILIGGAGNDFIDGMVGDDIVIGGGLGDATGGGNNLLSGGEGDDTVLGSSGNDWLYGDTRLFPAGLGFDSNGVAVEVHWHGEEFSGSLTEGRLHFWHGYWGTEHLREGGAYYDPVEGAGDDILDGGAGDDQAYGGAGNDQITGGAGGDLLVGEAGDDRLTGGDHDDSLFGDFSKLIYQNDNNVIDFDELFDHDLVTRVYRDPVNTAGNDVLDGGAGSDTLQGGHGNDVYVFGRGYGIDGVYDDAGVDRLRLGAEIQTGIEVYKYWSIEEYRIQESEFRRAA